MAIDVAVPQPRARARELGASRIAALPTQVVLGAIVLASFALRVVASLGHLIPLYFPDEYIYSSLARSIAASGRPLVRGGPAHFPALLEPILAAPFWLFHDPVLAYRLTQTENALAMSLAAVPMYLLARRIGLGRGFGFACAALAVACPDLLYASFILADPIAYPLALAAVYAGVCALDRPTRRGQLVFLAFAGLATFARVQYVFLPVAFLAASLVVERGRIRSAVRSVRFTLILGAVSVLAAGALGPGRLLGYYKGIGNDHLGLGFVHWIANDAMLLAYAAGWIVVPGALVGVALAIARPTSRAEAAFGGLVGISAIALFAEAGLYASNGSARFQERYLFLLVVLAAPAFGLWAQRARTGRRLIPAIAIALLLLSARVPISGYTVADAKQDSPFLFAVFTLERYLGIGNGSLAVALLAALLACAAGAVALVPGRRNAALGALVAGVAVAAVASGGAISFDAKNGQAVRPAIAPSDLRWVDHAGLGPADVLQTAGAAPEQTLQQLFWNTSLHRVLRLGDAGRVDVFDSPKVGVAPDGSILVAGRPVTRPLLVSSFATRADLAGATIVRSTPKFKLYQPDGVPRLSLVTTGLYYDGWLAGSGRITVWPQNGRLHGKLVLHLSLPPGPGSITLHLRGPGVKRTVTIRPHSRKTLTLPVRSTGRPWVLRFDAPRSAFLGDERMVSVKAAPPVFVPAGPAVGGRSVSSPLSCPATQTL